MEFNVVYKEQLLFLIIGHRSAILQLLSGHDIGSLTGNSMAENLIGCNLTSIFVSVKFFDTLCSIDLQ